MEVDKQEGGERERRGLGGGRSHPVGESKSSSQNEKQRESASAVSHEILLSSDFHSTKHALAPEVLSCRDLHYERSLMKEKLKGGLGGLALNPPPPGPDMKEDRTA